MVGWSSSLVIPSRSIQPHHRRTGPVSFYGSTFATWETAAICPGRRKTRQMFISWPRFHNHQLLFGITHFQPEGEPVRQQCALSLCVTINIRLLQLDNPQLSHNHNMAGLSFSIIQIYSETRSPRKLPATFCWLRPIAPLYDGQSQIARAPPRLNWFWRVFALATNIIGPSGPQ